jgi:hypothetical protein
MSPEPPPPSRSPRDYRPDLRPMIILIALIVVVVLAWLFLSPQLLPAV